MIRTCSLYRYGGLWNAETDRDAVQVQLREGKGAESPKCPFLLLRPPAQKHVEARRPLHKDKLLRHFQHNHAVLGDISCIRPLYRSEILVRPEIAQLRRSSDANRAQVESHFDV
jgi:hypothetical protein